LRKIEGNEIQKEREEGERERKIRKERGIEKDREEGDTEGLRKIEEKEIQRD